MDIFVFQTKSKLHQFNSKKVIKEHWGSKKKKILSKYSFLKDTTNYLFRFLVNKLNEIHNTTKSEEYWRIIIYPWVCYYVTTLYDRWQIISQLKKKSKNFSFHTFEYISKKNFLEIGDINEWWIKTQSDQFNNQIFHKILKTRRVKKLILLKKKLTNSQITKEILSLKKNFLQLKIF